MNFLDQIFSSSLTPHGYCLLWQPWLLWPMVIADALIGLSYYTLPLGLIWFVTRRKVDFGWLVWLFAIFILACGTTHFLDIWTIWHADYWLLSLVKIITAAVSVVTAVLIWPLLPKLMALPTPTEMRKVHQTLSQQVEEREQALKQLGASEARFRDLYNLTPVPLVSADEAGMLIDVSDALVSMLGYSRETLTTQHITMHMTPRSASRWRDELWPRLLAYGRLHDAELQFVCRDGRIVDVLLSSSVERDEDRGFIRAYSVLVDVTARKQAEIALTQQIEGNRRIREMLHQSQKMEAVGQLTGGIAHDFNNLLTAINGNLDLMSLRTRDNEGVGRMIESAQRAVQRGANLTKQLLSFSRRQVLRPETLGLAARFEAMTTLLTGSLRADITFDIALDKNLWPVLVDPGEFDLAVINICVNARDAMPKGGTLRIRAVNKSVTVSPEGSDLQGDFVLLSITDTGTGIPEEVLGRVFEPFFTTKEVGKGTGLGLSQVYGFARQSGGMAFIESRRDQGATVTLYLPRAGSVAMPARETDTEAAGGEILHGTVLMVEDDDDVAVAAEGLIEDLGFTVHRARAPKEALEFLAKGDTRFNIMFSDVVMPGPMNGIDLAREVQVKYPSLPIILTTGHSQAAASAAPEFFILPKPYTRDQLRAVLANSR